MTTKDFLERFEWDVIVHYMDKEIAEELHMRLAPCETEEFLKEYIKAHFAKFGEEFTIN